MNAVAVVGNPRTPSRTRVAAVALLQAIGGGPTFDLAEPELQHGLLAARPGARRRACPKPCGCAETKPTDPSG